MAHHRDEALVTIATFDTDFEAGLAKGALEAIGIRVLVQSLVQRKGGPWPATLQVFESDAARAATELRRIQMRVVTRSGDEEDGR